MRSRSSGVVSRSSIANLKEETSDAGRRERRRRDDDGRGRSPIRRSVSTSEHALGQASGSREGNTGSMEPGELSENIKTENITVDSSLEALFQLTAGITQPSLPTTGQA